MAKQAREVRVFARVQDPKDPNGWGNYIWPVGLPVPGVIDSEVITTPRGQTFVGSTTPGGFWIYAELAAAGKPVVKLFPIQKLKMARGLMQDMVGVNTEVGLKVGMREWINFAQAPTERWGMLDHVEMLMLVTSPLHIPVLDIPDKYDEDTQRMFAAVSDLAEFDASPDTLVLRDLVLENAEPDLVLMDERWTKEGGQEWNCCSICRRPLRDVFAIRFTVPRGGANLFFAECWHPREHWVIKMLRETTAQMQAEEVARRDKPLAVGEKGIVHPECVGLTLDWW